MWPDKSLRKPFLLALCLNAGVISWLGASDIWKSTRPSAPKEAPPVPTRLIELEAAPAEKPTAKHTVTTSAPNQAVTASDAPNNPHKQTGAPSTANSAASASQSSPRPLSTPQPSSASSPQAANGAQQRMALAAKIAAQKIEGAAFAPPSVSASPSVKSESASHPAAPLALPPKPDSTPHGQEKPADPAAQERFAPESTLPKAKTAQNAASSRSGESAQHTQPQTPREASHPDSPGAHSAQTYIPKGKEGKAQKGESNSVAGSPTRVETNSLVNQQRAANGAGRIDANTNPTDLNTQKQTPAKGQAHPNSAATRSANARQSTNARRSTDARQNTDTRQSSPNERPQATNAASLLNKSLGAHPEQDRGAPVHALHLPTVADAPSREIPGALVPRDMRRLVVSPKAHAGALTPKPIRAITPVFDLTPKDIGSHSANGNLPWTPEQTGKPKGRMIEGAGKIDGGGDGSGLLGQYFLGKDFDQPLFQRPDANIDFTWTGKQVDPRMPIHLPFSVRWTGKITPRYSETYTFYTASDDGVRLYIDGKLLIDNWSIHAASEDSAQADLKAGQAYPIVVEYYEKNGVSIEVIKLYWESLHQTKEYVPQSCFSYPRLGAADRQFPE